MIWHKGFFQPEIDAAIKNRGQAFENPDDVTESSSAEEVVVPSTPSKEFKIFTKDSGKFKVIKVEGYEDVSDLIVNLCSALGWPTKYSRYIEIYEHVTKVVGSKRYKKDRMCTPESKVFEIEEAWPESKNKDGIMTRELCYLYFDVMKGDKTPTQVHVAYGQI